MQPISDIIFEEIPGSAGQIGLITLNRQQALNALNHAMFIALDEQLIAWEKNTDIKAVVIRAAEGRAFCAGGDIRSVYERKLSNDATLASFFRDEYRMNSRIHHFSKPYIALLDGITMGGGVGISLHGSHRIATEKFIFSMPEVAIGFYPDVGTTYFLSRFPSHIGFYLALTGARLSYADCYVIGIVQEIVARESFPTILEALIETALPDKNAVTQVLQPFALPVPSSDLLQYKKEIDTCFSQNTIEDILYALEQESNEWCQKAAADMKTKSPTSLKVTLRALQEAATLNFDACMRMEHMITCHFLQSADFFEGIRAVIIDKDQTPRWKPDQLSHVTTQDVAKYFTPLTKELV